MSNPRISRLSEETPIVPRISGYVQKWNVDIGDHVKKGEILAVLWIPDMVEELNQRKVEVQQARKRFEVAEAHLAATAAEVEEAKAGLRRAEANAKYCRMQYDRITQLTDMAVINKQVKEENWNRLESAEAGVNEAEAKVTRTEANQAESAAERIRPRLRSTWPGPPRSGCSPSWTMPPCRLPSTESSPGEPSTREIMSSLRAPPRSVRSMSSSAAT